MLHPWSCHYSQYLVLEIYFSVKSGWSFTLPGVGLGLGGGQSLVVWHLQVEGVGRCWHGCCYVCAGVRDKVFNAGGTIVNAIVSNAVNPPDMRYIWKWLVLLGF